MISSIRFGVIVYMGEPALEAFAPFGDGELHPDDGERLPDDGVRQPDIVPLRRLMVALRRLMAARKLPLAAVVNRIEDLGQGPVDADDVYLRLPLFSTR